MTIRGSINLNVALFFAPAGLNTLYINLNGTIETFCVIILKFPTLSLYRLSTPSLPCNQCFLVHYEDNTT